MMYAIPYNIKLEKEINKLNCVKARLRAFPGMSFCPGNYTSDDYPYYLNFPGEKYELVILDSGAYSLSQSSSKKEIDDIYMYHLAEYYYHNIEKYKNSNIICVSPDKFLNPAQSMYNFMKWNRTNNFKACEVAAVLQSSRKGYADYNELKKQAEFYSNYTDKIFFSNPGLTGKDAKMYHLDRLFKYMKEKLSIKWIHNLGAGWSLQDIRDWQDIGYIDSMDSIAYYTEPDAYNAKTAIDAIKNIMEVAIQ